MVADAQDKALGGKTKGEPAEAESRVELPEGRLLGHRGAAGDTAPAPDAALDTILGAIIQGVSLYDGNHCLAVWNRRYEEYLKFPKGFLKAGLPVREMSLLLARRGDYGPGDPEALVDLRLSRMSNSSAPLRSEVTILGDRTYDVLSHPTPDGGWVATYTDVTEYKKIERELRENEGRLKALANTDPLTGIANRRSFFELGAAELRRAARTGRPVSVMVIDLDRFKATNDRFGHAAGDEVLRAFARVCQEGLRAHDVFGRIGGEEFAVLLGETGLAQARQAAERTRHAAETASVASAAGAIRFTVSVGLTEVREQDTLEAAIARADRALYTAKNEGRNRVAVSEA